MSDCSFVLEAQVWNIQECRQSAWHVGGFNLIPLFQNPHEFGKGNRSNERRFVGLHQLFEEALRRFPLFRVIPDRESQQNIRVDGDHLTDCSKLSTMALPIASSMSSIETGGPSYLMKP